MTNREMMELAMRQSAEDMGCHVEDFKADKKCCCSHKFRKEGPQIFERAYYLQSGFLWK